MGFHADQYSVKSMAEAINMCREGQLSLRRKVDVKAETAPARHASGGGR
jgi:hypothetical protein